MIKPGIYEHYKGGRYEVVSVGVLEATQEPVVIYKALYENPVSQWWVRPVSSWNEVVDVNGEMQPRFRLVSEN